MANKIKKDAILKRYEDEIKDTFAALDIFIDRLKDDKKLLVDKWQSDKDNSILLDNDMLRNLKASNGYVAEYIKEAEDLNKKIAKRIEKENRK